MGEEYAQINKQRKLHLLLSEGGIACRRKFTSLQVTMYTVDTVGNKECLSCRKRRLKDGPGGMIRVNI
jgi:hypothetical protein